MKKLMIALMLTVIAGVAEAKGSASIVASHIPAHVSSHQNAQANVGEPLSNKAQITIAATIILAFAFGITAIIWSGE
jgi:hypothetical protein